MDPDEFLPPELKKNRDNSSRDAAISMVRTKLDALYQNEPDAEAEVEEVEHITPSHMSKHQHYMEKLQKSGKDMAEIQTAWHEYYQSLPETEKHEVWQEFYSEQAKQKDEKNTQTPALNEETEKLKSELEEVKAKVAAHHSQAREPHKAKRNPRAKHRQAPVGLMAKIKQNQHVKSLVFGLSMGLFVVFFLLFSFFNERFISPFIRPSGNVSATPIIVDPNSTGPAGPESKIIIPKINVEAPVVYDVETIQEDAIQDGLERGVVHYATTPNPGEKGNAVIFGHSSGNILNKGKYKFAFILLKSLEEGDTFIIQKDRKKYVYKVYNMFVTEPNDFSVLKKLDKPATMTLITCDPPGTSTNRLIVQAEQIFPDPATNKKSSAKTTEIAQPDQLPSNSKSLWQRLIDAF